MTKFIITTESGSDITPELQQLYNVYLVPMHVTLGDQTYLDGSISVAETFAYYDQTGQLPKTSGTTPQDNTTVFTQVLADHPDATIFHIGYSAATTVSFNSARLAAAELPNVHLVDSKHLTASLTAVIIATGKFIAAHPDCTAAEVIAFVAAIRERTHFHFIPRTLTFLQAGGRVSNTAVFAAKLLKIYPTIKLADGRLVPGKKYRGSFEQALQKMVTDFVTTCEIDPDTLLIGGALGFSADHHQLVRDLLADHGFHDVPWINTGTVISSHGGPGSFGIIGIEKAKGED